MRCRQRCGAQAPDPAAGVARLGQRNRDPNLASGVEFRVGPATVAGSDGAHARPVNTKPPDESVREGTRELAFVLEAVTHASGTGLPCSSSTRPDMEPFLFWISATGSLVWLVGLLQRRHAPTRRDDALIDDDHIGELREALALLGSFRRFWANGRAANADLIATAGEPFELDLSGRVDALVRSSRAFESHAAEVAR